MRKKILLVAGCSYSNERFTSIHHPELDVSWPKWPQLLADRLDMELINLSESGAGQEYIYSNLIDKLQTIDCNSIQNCNIPSKDLKNILSTLYLKGGFLNLLQHVDNMNERESILKKILDLLNTFKVDYSRTNTNFGGNKKTRNKKKGKKIQKNIEKKYQNKSLNW